MRYHMFLFVYIHNEAEWWLNLISVFNDRPKKTWINEYVVVLKYINNEKEETKEENNDHTDDFIK